MVAGIAFLNAPAVVLAYIGGSGILPVIYFIPLVWSVLILTNWLFLRMLIDYVGNLGVTFLAIYFPESSIFTLAAFLHEIVSFSQRVLLVLSFVTILVYLIPLGITIKAGSNEMKREAFFDEDLSDRLRKLVGKRQVTVPDVCIMPAPG